MGFAGTWCISQPFVANLVANFVDRPVTRHGNSKFATKFQPGPVIRYIRAKTKRR